MPVKNFKLIKTQILRTISISLVSLILLNSIIIFSFYSTPSDTDQNNYPQLINREVNSAADSFCTKINIKQLSGTNADNYYSYESCFKKLGSYPKIFTIISETYSEQNIRYSSFLLAQSTTST